MELKHYDVSREGNDCWIHEHWYYLNHFKVAMKVTKVDGWCEQEVDAVAYHTATDEMPRDVQDWFS